MKISFITKRHFRTTESDLFLIALLEEFAQVEVIRKEEMSSWQLTCAIFRFRPDWVVFFATQPSFFHHVLRFFWTKILFVPMWDGFKPLSKRGLFKLFGVRILSFAQGIADYFHDFRCLDVRYFPPLQQRVHQRRTQPPYRVFWWKRHPLHLQITNGEIISKTEWMSKEQMLDLVATCDYYVAPREQEGIGMGFLEALALGVPVIAHNDQTMNLYIKDGVNGVFFDGPLTLPPPASLNVEGPNQAFRARWEADRVKIRAFIERDGVS